MRFARLLPLALLLSSGVARADTATDLGPELRRFLGTWLEVQNKGDFDGYEKLYATRFTGVRRSGPRTVALDRAGWMKDRRRMFGKPMTVTADEVKVAAAPSASVVTFLQSWSSGSWADKGEKQLVVVREGGALKIAREELLRSSLEGRPRAAAAGGLRWVVQQHLVISAEPDEGLAAGPPVLTIEEPLLATRPVAEKKLAPADRALLGQEVATWDDQGRRCAARVRSFALVALGVSHFGQRQAWNEVEGAAALKGAGEEAWEQGRHYLVAKLDGCSGATWAAVGKEPVVHPASEAAPALAARAVAKLRGLPAWKTLQGQFRADGGKGRWDEAEGASTTVRELDAVIGGATVHLVSITTTLFNGCADFSGQLWALFEVRGQTLVLRNTPGERVLVPSAAADLDGGGSTIVGSPGALDAYDAPRIEVRPSAAVWDQVDTLFVPFHDCPC